MNAVLLQFVTDKYPQWVIGLLAGTGFLLALAPGSVLLLTAGSIFSRNIVAPFKRHLSEKQSLRISRTSVVVFAAIAVAITLTQKGSLVSILLSAYSAIGMLAPGVFLGFLWKRTSATGVVCGIIVGFMILLLPSSSAYLATALPNWEPGLIAMLANALVVIGVSVLTKAPSAKHVELGLLTPSAGHFTAP